MLRAASTAARAAPAWAARRGGRPAPRAPPPRRRALVAAAAASAPPPPPAQAAKEKPTSAGAPTTGVAAPQLTLYDTMQRAKRAFEPRGGGPDVGLYCCGVTVYDYSHIGELLWVVERKSGF